MRLPRAVKVVAELLLAAIVLCGCELAPAQTQQPPISMPAQGPYRIAGMLVNAISGEPVRRASVEALNEEDGHAVASCVSDAEGRFSLDHLAAAKYSLTASKRGFRTGFYDEHDQFSTAIVTGPDQETTHLEFKLTPNAVLRGIVTDDGGEAVAGARVMLFKRPTFAGSTEQIVPGDTTMTDDTGAYDFGDLAAGEYLLAVVAEPWYAVHEGSATRRNTALDVAYPVTYFDSTMEEQSATPIALAGGSREEADISMHAVPAVRISVAGPRRSDGSVERPELQQSIFGQVMPVQSEEVVDALQRNSFELSGIAPGHYVLTQGDPPRVMNLDLTSNQQVDPSGGSVANAVEGTIRMQSGAPAPDEVTLSLQRMQSGQGQYIYATEARRGRFRFDAVPQGEWALAATSSGRTLSVMAVSAGAAQRAGNVITLGERAPELVVTLSDSATKVEGFAKKDGKGFAGALIVLLPKNPAQWRALTTRDQSDSDGSFALADVAPGKYTLIAIEDGWKLDWTSPSAMARYLPRGIDVTVTGQSGALMQLNLPVPVQGQ